MTYPVQNIARRTSLLRVDLVERQLEADATLRPASVLRGAEDGDGGGERDGGGGPPLLHSQGPGPGVHQQPGKLRLAPPLLGAGPHDVVFGLGLALDLKHKAQWDQISLLTPLTVCPIFQCSSVRTPATRSLALNVSE